ncbi:MAG: phosphoenolpyruvate synthase [Cyanobacteria bacterium Co-bin13]|nr:phosphoenolpyruvate synthase [Cyanobacteria bacterium Co-bin13]
MLPFRLLAQIADADLAAVGEKAMALRDLKQLGLPVVEGGVLLAEAWSDLLTEVVQTADKGDLSQLNPDQPQALRQMAQALRQALLEHPLNLDLSPVLESVQAPWLLLRPSLFLADQEPGTPQKAAELLGLLTARPCVARPDAIAAELKQLWAEGLRAGNLMVWRRHCQSLRQVRLAALVQPLYPSEVSGTVVLGERAFSLEAVLGLGQALAQGEAVPARCQGNLQQLERISWQSGYQERVYRLREKPSMVGSAGLVVQVREEPELPAPLTLEQVQELLRLGRQVQQQWSLPVRLEWLIYKHPQTRQSSIVITQASRWWEALKADVLVTDQPPGAIPGQAETAAPHYEALLPEISGVVQGIGAASGRAIGPAVVLQAGSLAAQMTLPLGCIVVLPDLQPEMCVRLQGVAGIVTVRGGATCHAAILARELNIPAVVGAPQATELLKTGDALWLDGDRGIVYLLPEDKTGRPLFESRSFAQAADPPVDLPGSPGAAAGSSATQVMVNLSQVQRLGDLPLEQIDGVGLLRSEWLLIDMLEGRHPQQWVTAGYGVDLQARLVEKLAPILAAFAPRPVRYRSLDLRSHEWISLAGSPPAEPNPMLGIRGTFSYQLDPRLFKLELGALAALQRQGHTNLQLMLPFVRTVEEFGVCRQWVEQARLFQTPAFQLWIMAEVPSVLFLLPAYRRAGVQGIAIGTNDLTQLLLAVDRDQPVMASAYDERHPAVIAALAHLVQTARQQGLACSICGQAPVRHPELIDALVQWGISSISVEPGALIATRRAVLASEQRQRNPF